MPYKPPHPCSHSGCAELTHEKYCERHAPETKRERREYDQHRGTAAQRGYNSWWARIRRYVLTSEPLCRRCYAEGCAEPAVLVHHIDRNPRNNERKNLEPLCEICHNFEHRGERRKVIAC